MKKSGVYLAAACMCVLFSCSDEDKMARVPDVKLKKDGSVDVSLARNENAKYINVFRKESGAADESSALNIGEIIPTKEDNKASYIFSDEYFLEDGKKYEYAARYCFSDGYVMTGWGTWDSDELVSGAKPYRWKDSNAPASYLEYNEKSMQLKVCGAEIPPVYKDDSRIADDFAIAIVLSYALDSGAKKTRTFAVKRGEGQYGLPVDSSIDLRSMLPQDFLDRPIFVEGMIAQKAKSDGYEAIYWSQLWPLEVKDEKGKNLSSITIPFVSSPDNMYDYSGAAGRFAAADEAYFLNEVYPAAFEYILHL